MEPARFIDAGDTVVATGRHRGRTLAGEAFDVPWVHRWTLHDGKTTELEEVFDSAPVVQALAGSGDAESILRRMFDEIINQGRLEVADELFAEYYVDHGPMGESRVGRASGRWSPNGAAPFRTCAATSTP